MTPEHNPLIVQGNLPATYQQTGQAYQDLESDLYWLAENMDSPGEADSDHVYRIMVQIQEIAAAMDYLIKARSSGPARIAHPARPKKKKRPKKRKKSALERLLRWGI